MSQGLVDFHCHLDLYPDHPALVEECERLGVHTLTVTTTPKAWPRNHALASQTRHVRAALGLHPQLVADRSAEVSLWESYLDETRYVGEVGLDAGPRFFRSLDQQKQVFDHVLRTCGRRGGKILTVHSIRAAKGVLDAIEAHLPSSRGRVVLHWFTGSASEARRAVDLGCYFSLNAEMLRNERAKGMIVGLPIERVLTETDGPFTRTGDRPAHPADVAIAINLLADLRGSNREATGRQVTKNLRTLLMAADIDPG
ncbi:TatD family hydrolase [Phenylobacterium sp. LjRoot225]|uniref:Qat anti-phage system TatD family nuclease QatD n=1 Tax=Phenylobacterium sp. LjRoot225 TaxID=3342285 RepID=UPI003ED1666C